MTMVAPSPATSATILTTAERTTLRAVCDALLPSLLAGPDDDPRLFICSAADLDVATAIEGALASFDQGQQAEFRRLLQVLDRPFVNQLLIGRRERFYNLALPERERLLLTLATSRLPMLRTGFQALKRLATFLFYSLPDAGGQNPTWPALSYTPSPNLPARPAVLKLTSIDRTTTLECDVCVIGSGAGGSVVAAELAAANKRVIVLEAGSGQQAPDFDQREFVGMQHLYLDQGLISTRDLGVAILAGATIGGGTAINWQTSLSTPPAIRDEWAASSGCRHFADASFTRSLDAVTARLHVNETESQVNRNNAMLRDGCDALGYRWQTLPRNAHGCDPAQCGYCVYGCRHGGKQSAAVTYLADAQQGDTAIVARCRAERVILSNGRVTGVEASATDATGRAHAVTVRAPIVVVAAGAIHSPLLLLRSGLTLPAIGRNLFLHPTTAVSGTYKEPIELWSGPPQTILCNEFAELSSGYGFRLETAPAHPGLLALATPWFSARDHRRQMQAAAYKSATIVLVRDHVGGRVQLGRYGKPVVTYRPGPQERAHLQRGVQEAVRVHLAAGAHEVLTLHARQQYFKRAPEATSAAIDAFCAQLARQMVDRNWLTLFSAHQMGTCRMGSDPRTAVCDGDGAVFGARGLFVADGSAFPASSGVNPMITIMALAHHTAQRIKALV
ncbi:MAG: GMC family oxidoreductase N-terminal domain-containing protein [Chloroflexi bacterium]|nr:GMC family oxidoreductase N-terminal domain-containing protein [Chloroflexota bacterium]